METKGFKLDEENKIPHGMTTPPGYFAMFNKAMAQRLPVNPAAENPAGENSHSRTLWQKFGPYISMAAMFAGVWCMTQLFGLMRNDSNSLSIENNQVLTAALSNNDFYTDYVVSSVDEYDLLDVLYEQGVDLTSYNF